MPFFNRSSRPKDPQEAIGAARLPEPSSPSSTDRGVRLTSRQRGFIITTPIVIAIGTAVGLMLVTSIHDPATEWAAIAAVVTGAAALVAVIGLPIAIWQLIVVQKEQERIAEQLAAQPKIRIGLRDPETGLLAASITHRQPQLRTVDDRFILPITVVAENVGERTAHKPRIVVLVPNGMIAFGFTEVGDQTRDDGRGGKYVLALQEVLNPGESRPVSFVLEPQEPLFAADEISLTCRVTSEDARPIDETLTVKLEFT